MSTSTSTAVAAHKSTPTKVKSGRRGLLWRVRLSALYHLKRERFLDGVDKSSKFVSAIGGAAAFAQFKESPELGMWITGLIAITSTLSLVYGFSAKARKHAELARDFKRLEAEITAAGEPLTAAQISSFDAKFLLIESGEPATLGALVTACHNELARAEGSDEHITPLHWFESIFKNWIDFDQSKDHSSDKKICKFFCK